MSLSIIGLNFKPTFISAFSLSARKAALELESFIAQRSFVCSAASRCCLVCFAGFGSHRLGST